MTQWFVLCKFDSISANNRTDKIQRTLRSRRGSRATCWMRIHKFCGSLTHQPPTLDYCLKNDPKKFHYMQNFIIMAGQRNKNTVPKVNWQIHKNIINKVMNTSWIFIQIIPKYVCGHVCYVGPSFTWCVFKNVWITLKIPLCAQNMWLFIKEGNFFLKPLKFV